MQLQRIKTEKTKNYTVINNTIFKDKTISLKARGLFAMVMSLPDDWDFSVSGIIECTIEGKTAVYSALNELLSKGYVKRVYLYENGKRIKGGVEYTFMETPIKPVEVLVNPENLDLENLDLENLKKENLKPKNKPQLNTHYHKVKNEENKKLIYEEELANSKNFFSEGKKPQSYEKEKKEKAPPFPLPPPEKVKMSGDEIRHHITIENKAKFEGLVELFGDNQDKAKEYINNQLQAFILQNSDIDEKFINKPNACFNYFATVCKSNFAAWQTSQTKKTEKKETITQQKINAQNQRYHNAENIRNIPKEKYYEGF